MNKVYPDAKSALADLMHDNMLVMSGGFGLCGTPQKLIEAVRDLGTKGLKLEQDCVALGRTDRRAAAHLP